MIVNRIIYSTYVKLDILDASPSNKTISEMVTKDINKVICENEEIKMLNIRNRKNGGSGNC